MQPNKHFRSFLQAEGIPFEENASLAKLTTVGIGNRVQYWVQPQTEAQILSIAHQVKQTGLPFWIHGLGSNVFFALEEDPYPGVLLTGLLSSTSELEFISTQEGGGLYTRDLHAGLKKTYLARALLKLYIQAAIWLHGIPGTLGGGVAMNAGTPKGSFADIINDVTLVDLQHETVQRIKLSPSDFDYRTQTFRSPWQLITRCSLHFPSPMDPAKFKAAMNKARTYRKQSQPLQDKSFGSTFKNPKIGHAGVYLSQSGLKGHQIGDAMISPKHANFFTNIGEAKGKDMLHLIQFAQKKVYQDHGIELEPEVQIIRAFHQL